MARLSLDIAAALNYFNNERIVVMCIMSEQLSSQTVRIPKLHTHCTKHVLAANNLLNSYFLLFTFSLTLSVIPTAQYYIEEVEEAAVEAYALLFLFCQMSISARYQLMPGPCH